MAPFVTAQGQTFTGMLVAGANLSQIDGDELLGFHKIGLNTGLRANARLSERWSLSLEMLYSQQGSRRATNDNPGAVYDKIRLNWVEAPVMINFSDWKILASAGISYGRLVNYQVEDVLGNDITELEEYRPDMFSIVFGGTFFFSEDWGLNIRWSKYLTDLRADPDDTTLLGRNVGIRLFYLL